MPSRRRDEHRALFGLFRRMFVENELRGFFALYYPSAKDSLPGAGASLSHLVLEAVLLLDRFGLVCDELFANLVDFRPESTPFVIEISRQMALRATVTSSPPNSVPSLEAEPRSEHELLDELATVFAEHSRAAMLLSRVGFPRALLPHGSDPLSLWSRILEAIEHGAPPRDVRFVADEAARLYPNNAVFLRHRVEPRRPTGRAV